MNIMSLASLRTPYFLILATSLMLFRVTYAEEIFADDFDDNSINSTKWNVSGNAVNEVSQRMQVMTTSTDAGGKLSSVSFPINQSGAIVIRRKVLAHYANSNFAANIAIRFGDTPWAAIYYANHTYSDSNFMPRYGTFIGRNVGARDGAWVHVIARSAQADVSGAMPVAFDTWFNEQITYTPKTGILQYHVNDQKIGDYFIGIMPSTNEPTLELGFSAWGWYTGHQQFMDDLTVTQEQVTVTPLPQYIHNPADGRQAVKEFRFAPGGQCGFTFSTGDPGAMCIVSWTSNLKKWFPLIHFNTTAQGTEVLDTPRDPSKFYRTTYLPAGVSAAESFDYPIGSGTVDEQIVPERNDLYLISSIANPERVSISPGSGWYNAQDVGCYYATVGGLHGGEDWNKGSGVADIGEPIKAIANGQVIEIRPAGASGVPGTSGYAVVIRHWLLNGDSMDSLYVHIAPDQSGGSFNGLGAVGDKSDFSFQIGDPVTKGSIIGVVGAVSAFSPHLHFEIRSKPFNVSGPLWPSSTGNGNYGPTTGIAGRRFQGITAEEVRAAFLLMQQDGIIDPSDFIDDHR